MARGASNSTSGHFGTAEAPGREGVRKCVRLDEPSGSTGTYSRGERAASPGVEEFGTKHATRSCIDRGLVRRPILGRTSDGATKPTRVLSGFSEILPWGSQVKQPPSPHSARTRPPRLPWDDGTRGPRLKPTPAPTTASEAESYHKARSTTQDTHEHTNAHVSNASNHCPRDIDHRQKAKTSQNQVAQRPCATHTTLHSARSITRSNTNTGDRSRSNYSHRSAQPDIDLHKHLRSFDSVSSFDIE